MVSANPRGVRPARLGRPVLAFRTEHAVGLLAVAVVLAAGLLHTLAPELHDRLLQEDGPVEWATVWSLVAAAGAFGVLAFRASGWSFVFPALASLGCLVVAGEEISWGQRLLGLQPPDYFLAHNDQQELNLHNVLPKDLRQLGLQVVLLGYGLGLPLFVRVGRLRDTGRRLGIEAPAPGVALGFVGAAALYAVYPFRFTGEWVELLLGIGLAADSLLRLARGRARAPARVSLATAAVVLLLAAGSTGWSRSRASDPAALDAARSELAALARDFRAGRVRTRCGQHKRVYRLAARQSEAALAGGRFRELTTRGLDPVRAEYVLDPWSSPYWVRDACSRDGGRRLTLYSLGPNRLRDSTRDRVAGDDLVLIVAQGGPHPEPPSSLLGANR